MRCAPKSLFTMPLRSLRLTDEQVGNGGIIEHERNSVRELTLGISAVALAFRHFPLGFRATIGSQGFPNRYGLAKGSVRFSANKTFITFVRLDELPFAGFGFGRHKHSRLLKTNRIEGRSWF
jgi:hypothetical protein